MEVKKQLANIRLSNGAYKLTVVQLIDTEVGIYVCTCSANGMQHEKGWKPKPNNDMLLQKELLKEEINQFF